LGAFPHHLPRDEWLLKKIEEWNTKLITPIHYEERIVVRLWEKLAVNSVINPLTALLECPNGELLQPVYDSLICQLIEEMVQVAKAKGIDLDPSRLLERVRQVCHRTSSNFSSMLQDLRNGRKTEIDAINGILVSYGRETGIVPKMHQLLWELIKAKEARLQRKNSNGEQ
jgi:2-dehydropantoate 2-reductase